MTGRALYEQARRALAAAGVDSPGPDALLLSERFLGLDRTGLALHGDKCPPPEAEAAFLKAVSQRAQRRPLQYILGEWEFMGLTLAVGEGVLCPREDTGVLVEALVQALKNAAPKEGMDLCAGTGAVGLGICALLPGTRVTCVELSDQALPYLEQNIRAYPQYHVSLLRGDVLLPETAAPFPPGSLDFIAANPPYIKSAELPTLQPEVQKEPALALDGGADGLLFYRAILSLWAPLLKPGGLLGVEISEDQGEDVSGLFLGHGFADVQVKQDLSGLNRVVIGTAP